MALGLEYLWRHSEFMWWGPELMGSDSSYLYSWLAVLTSEKSNSISNEINKPTKN